MGPLTLERFLPEEFEGANDLGAGLTGDFFDRLEVDAILAELFGGDQVGGFTIVLTELAEAGGVGLFRARRDRQEGEVGGERV